MLFFFILLSQTTTNRSGCTQRRERRARSVIQFELSVLSMYGRQLIKQMDRTARIRMMEGSRRYK